MAGLSQDKNGSIRITFRDAGGTQKSLRFGKCSERIARLALSSIEHLLEAKRHDAAPHHDAVRWLERIDDRIHSRIAALGLTQPRDSANVTLGILIERFMETATVKPSTLVTYSQAARSLREVLGTDTPLSRLTPATADHWRKSIAEPVKAESATRPMKRLASATVAKRVRVAKAVFRNAVKWKLISSNPFEDLRAGSQANPERSFYVTRESIRAVLAECPDDQWRGIIALTRYGGLRCPSEIVGLKWGDVNWERGRLTVRSPKTAGHEGHGVRIVPISLELRPILQDLFDQAEAGMERVIPRLSDPEVNLRKGLGRIIERAGLTPWPRRFQNLRASCATDWVEQFPNHTVAKWLGHSPTIAATHYLQTRDVHFDMAAGIGVVANQATHTLPGANTASQVKTKNTKFPAEFVVCGALCDPVKNEKVTPMGFEPMCPP